MLLRVRDLLLCSILLGCGVTAAPLGPNAEPLDYLSELEERGACNADNLLRLIRGQDNLAEGLDFCGSWLGRINPTQTIVEATVTPTITVTTTEVSTSTDLTTETQTQTLTSSLTATYTLTATQTVYLWRRGAPKVPLSDRILSTYPASRISSACGCLTYAPFTTATSYVTEIAPEVTQTYIIPSVTQTSNTITETATTYTSVVSTVTTRVWSTKYIAI
ncbi:hypothetical protein ABW19_dt0208658 [Dactylella cylindrospora]|nr:hypothetical protein ABW19_dt0208658 [Dactylella cylindrospora]